MIPKRNVTPIREKFSTKLHTMPEIVFCFKVDKFSSSSNQCSALDGAHSYFYQAFPPVRSIDSMRYTLYETLFPPNMRSASLAGPVGGKGSARTF
jgi:hypothetical protein